MKRLFTLFLALTATTLVFAQAPQQVKYQGVARDAAGAVIANGTLTVQFDVHTGSASGPIVYTESHAGVTTNMFGLFSINMGSVTPFPANLFGAGMEFLEVSVDFGTGLTSMGTSQFLSVPYALFADSSANPGPAGAMGPSGADGATGAVGAMGPSGADGATGAVGAMGPSGADGATGAVGAAGPAGANGATGATGPSGADGATGAVGAAGPAGAMGAAGPAGPMGPAGANGATGATGAAGAVGAMGPAGPAGPMGPAGANGATGAVGPTGPGSVTGTINYVSKFTAANALGNSLMQDNGTSMSINSAPVLNSQLYVNRTQLTVNGDNQATVYAYRTRDSQNDGTGYGNAVTNSAVKSYNFWGDVYTFGSAAYNWNDYSRCGGAFGADQGGTYWGSLGYRSSGLLNYGVYGSAAYANGAGRMSNGIKSGIGAGFYGDLMGGWVRGEVMGLTTMGSLYSAFNIGNTFTVGYHADLVRTGSTMTPAYAVTSTSVKVYDDGSNQLSNGTVRVNFTPEYAALIAGSGKPTVTVSAMGQCNGLYIVSIDEAGFTVAEMNGGSSNVEFSWIAVGKRTDAGTAPEVLTSPTFTEKMQGVMFNDGNTEQSGTPLFWNGSSLEFNAAPAVDKGPKIEPNRK